MKDGDTRGQEQLIKNLKKRLHWYAYECEPEEFNEKEVRTIVELLRQLEPIEPQEYFNAEKGLERFWKYYEQRLEEEETLERSAASSERADRGAHGISAQHEDMEAGEDMAVLDFGKAAASREAAHTAQGSLAEKNDGDKVNRSSGHEGSRKSRLSFFGRHKAMGGTVVAAVLILMLSISGAFGAYAEKDTGFFHWISKDKGSVEFITSPQGGVDSGINSTHKYTSLTEVPEDLLHLIWIPEEIPEQLELIDIDVLETSSWKRITIGLGNVDSSLYVEIGLKIFVPGVVFHRQAFTDYEFLYENTIDNINMEFYKKESDNEIEHAVCFYGEMEQYSVQGNIPEDEIVNLATCYAKYVVNNF